MKRRLEDDNIYYICKCRGFVQYYYYKTRRLLRLRLRLPRAGGREESYLGKYMQQLYY